MPESLARYGAGAWPRCKRESRCCKTSFSRQFWILHFSLGLQAGLLANLRDRTRLPRRVDLAGLAIRYLGSFVRNRQQRKSADTFAIVFFFFFERFIAF